MKDYHDPEASKPIKDSSMKGFDWGNSPYTRRLNTYWKNKETGFHIIDAPRELTEDNKPIRPTLNIKGSGRWVRCVIHPPLYGYYDIDNIFTDEDVEAGRVSDEVLAEYKEAKAFKQFVEGNKEFFADEIAEDLKHLETRKPLKLVSHYMFLKMLPKLHGSLDNEDYYWEFPDGAKFTKAQWEEKAMSKVTPKELTGLKMFLIGQAKAYPYPPSIIDIQEDWKEQDAFESYLRNEAAELDGTYVYPTLDHLD